MKRGEVWTVAGGADYAGKPRPAVIVQNDLYDATASVSICLFTSTAIEADFRIQVTPSSDNGLLEPSFVMADKVTTIPRSKIGHKVGILSEAELEQLDRAMALFLGIGTK